MDSSNFSSYHALISIIESHIREDVHKLLLASVSGNQMGIEEAAMVVKGRSSRLAHMVKTEIRENPVRYSQDNIQHLNEAVQKLESDSNDYYDNFEAYLILLAM